MVKTCDVKGCEYHRRHDDVWQNIDRENPHWECLTVFRCHHPNARAYRKPDSTGGVKVGENHERECGKEFRARKSWNSKTNPNRKTCSNECYTELMKRINSNENAPNWRGGYSQTHYQRIARETKPRQCEMCGKTDVRLDVHHIDHNRTNNSADNLMILCVSCHAKLHYFSGDTGIRGAPIKSPSSIQMVLI